MSMMNVNLLDGSPDVQIDPNQDPVGYSGLLFARARNRKLAQPPQTTPDNVLSDPNMDAFLESFQVAGQGRPVKVAGGPSPLGSNQFRGQAISPITDFDPAMNPRLAGALSGLRRTRRA